MSRILFIFAFLFASNTWAYDLSLYGGPHFSSGDQTFEPEIAGSTTTTEGALGGQLGLRLEAPIHGSSLFLGGGLELDYKNLVSDDVIDLHFFSADLPVFLKYMFTENFGIYGGLKLSFNLDSRCDGQPNCEIGDGFIEPLVFPIFVGVSVPISESFGIEAFYEYGLTPIMKADLSTPSTVHYEAYINIFGINAVYKF